MSDRVTAEQDHSQQRIEARADERKDENSAIPPGCAEIFSSQKNCIETGQERVRDPEGHDNEHGQRSRDRHADDRVDASWIRSNFPPDEFPKRKPIGASGLLLVGDSAGLRRHIKASVRIHG